MLKRNDFAKAADFDGYSRDHPVVGRWGRPQSRLPPSDPASTVWMETLKVVDHGQLQLGGGLRCQRVTELSRPRASVSRPSTLRVPRLG